MGCGLANGNCTAELRRCTLQVGILWGALLLARGLLPLGACLPLASPFLPHLQCALHLHSLHRGQALLSTIGLC